MLKRTGKDSKRETPTSESVSNLIDIEDELNKRVLDALMRGLGHFGSSAIVESLLYILELEYSVDTSLLASNLSMLRSGFARMFGAGAYVVENKVREELAKQAGVDSDGKTLEDLIELTRLQAQSHN